MRILYGIESADKIKEYPIITIGSFDGVHRGHKKLLNSVRKVANYNDKEALAITFQPHPQIVLRDIKENFLLTTLEEKVKILKESNLIDSLLILKFDKSFAQLTAMEFIENIILDTIKPSHIVMGYDSHFGKNRLGDLVLLKSIMRKKNIEVDVVEPYILKEENISSSYIRRLLKFGHIEEANEYLGYEYFIKGTVIKGKGRGALLGFPTANIELCDEIKVLPQMGVYAVKVLYNKKFYKGVMNIGKRPTFSEDKLSIEVHILNLNENLYNKRLKIFFLYKIRDEVKFSSDEELIKQIKKDIQIK